MEIALAKFIFSAILLFSLKSSLLVVKPLDRADVSVATSEGFGEQLHHGSRNFDRTNRARGKYCFEDKCTCVSHKKWLRKKGVSVDCTNNNGTLAFIPQIKFNGSSYVILSLDFSFNNLTSIPNDEFFSNVTYIGHLNVSNNNIEYVSSGAFHVLVYLRVLVLDNNRKLYTPHLTAKFPVGLRKLYLKSTGLREINGEFFKTGSSSFLTVLDVSNNNLVHCNFSGCSHAARSSTRRQL
jgi:hypothetical protein